MTYTPDILSQLIWDRPAHYINNLWFKIPPMLQDNLDGAAISKPRDVISRGTQIVGDIRNNVKFSYEK